MATSRRKLGPPAGTLARDVLDFASAAQQCVLGCCPVPWAATSRVATFIAGIVVTFLVLSTLLASSSQAEPPGFRGQIKEEQSFFVESGAGQPMMRQARSAPMMAKASAMGSSQEADAMGSHGVDQDNGQPLIRKIQLETTLNLEVLKVQEASAKLVSLAVALGGYIVRSSVEGNRSATVAVRVPTEKIKTYLAEARLQAIVVELDQQTGTDVTDQFIDTESRLANLQAVITKMNALLSRATDVSQALQVHRELTRLTEQLEVQKGRLKYLTLTTELSLVNVFLHTRELSSPPTQWSPSKTIGKVRPGALPMCSHKASIGVGAQQKAKKLLLGNLLCFCPAMVFFNLSGASSQSVGLFGIVVGFMYSACRLGEP